MPRSTQSARRRAFAEEVVIIHELLTAVREAPSSVRARFAQNLRHHIMKVSDRLEAAAAVPPGQSSPAIVLPWRVREAIVRMRIRASAAVGAEY
jgi:hypothetical protein